MCDIRYDRRAYAILHDDCFYCIKQTRSHGDDRTRIRKGSNRSREEKKLTNRKEEYDIYHYAETKSIP